MPKVTIKEVAKEAGVSIGTVSNALNKADILNADTKERVFKAIKKLNYTPNLNGKMLKVKSSKTLGFFTTCLTGQYFSIIVDSMSRECEKNGYTLNVFVTRDNNVIMSNILGKRFDGVIIFEDSQITKQHIISLEKEKIPSIFIDREISSRYISSVLFKSFEAGYDVTQYLINLGHKKIAFITGANTVYDSLKRKEGYLSAMKEYNLPVYENYLIEGMFEEEYTYNSIKMFMKYSASPQPDAIIAGNDQSAVGCIRALASEGYKVPDDISVLGFDDIDIARYFSPPITTIRNPISRQGILAVNNLIGIIEGTHTGTVINLDTQLIVRDSCSVKKMRNDLLKTI